MTKISFTILLSFVVALSAYAQQRRATIVKRPLTTTQRTEIQNVVITESISLPNDTALVTKAKAGDATAQWKVGKCYFDGEKGVMIDNKEAFKWFQKSAEQDNPFAKFYLGRCYDEGFAVIVNYTKANAFYKEAVKGLDTLALEGNSDAQYLLGMCYDSGFGIEENISEAIKWYKAAAEHDNVEAQCELGFIYSEDGRVKKSYADAVKWYKSAAEQGNAGAQCNLGFCYEKGRGVTKSFNEAAKWYRLAAEQGLPDAQYNLAVCYENGNGVTLSHTEAVKWYKISADSYVKKYVKDSDFKQLGNTGIYYKVLKDGNGARPTAMSKVSFNYEVSNMKNEIFDSSYERDEPAIMQINQIIVGLQKALLAMRVGSHWEIVIPYNLAYGAQGGGDNIRPYSPLVFQIELMNIEKR